MKLKPTLKSKALQEITARDFSGGLNFVDSEFNLASRYAVAGYNMVPNENGDLQVRWGTRLFATLSSALDARIVAMEYYFSYLIAVDADGNIAAVSGNGTVTQVWSSFIAAALPGAPAGWGPTPTASFAQFLGGLIIANGTDKPIVVDITLTASYLQDLGSGSNINTPIAKYVVAHNNYVVMAGDPLKPGRLYISNSGTSGTWPGDALPNDAITFDVDKYAPDSSGEIVSITSFRDRLIVFFSEYIVTLKLGIYNTATPPVHTPTVDDTIKAYGAVSHRAVVNTGDLLIFLDYTGVSSIKQATFTQAMQPSRIGQLIDSQIQRALSVLPRGLLQTRCFALYDRRESRIMFFIPTSTDTNTAFMQRVFVYSIGQRGTKAAWSEYTQWTFQAGATTVEGRVFFGTDRETFLHGSRYEPILSDYENFKSYDGPLADKVNVIVNGVLCYGATLGQGIKFYHELPYNEMKDRTKWKTLHYITMDTQGASTFTLSLFVDDLKKRVVDIVGQPWSDGTLFDDGYGWSTDVAAVPYAAMTFLGGDRDVLNPVTPSSSARPTDHMNLYAIYSRFRFFKWTFSGTSYSHLRFVSLSMYYSVGSIY